jgi:serine protease
MQQSFARNTMRALALALSLGVAGGVAAASPELSQRINTSALTVGAQYEGFIIHFREGSRAAGDASAALAAVQPVATRLGTRATHVRTLAAGGELVDFGVVGSRLDAISVMELIAANPDVAYVEPNAIMRASFTPNDSSYGQQWHYFEAAGGLNLPPAWDVANGTGVVVAVLDTGSTSHSDLNGNTIAGYDFISSSTTARDGNGRDSNPQDQGDWYAANECVAGWPAANSSWHGTHVAGTIAAVTNNSAGVAGVAFGAKVQHVRVLGKCGGTLADIADGIVWASGGTVAGIPVNATPAKVINMSLGGGGSCGTTYQNAITSAVNRGTVVIVAAGNENQNASNSRPANCSNVVAVAAVGRNGGKASYSNFGTVVDVAAPGGGGTGVLSTLNNGTTVPGSEGYAFYQGTSMATPHVAGAAALILDVASKTPGEIEQILKTTTRAFPATCSQCGTGIVDAYAAVQAAGGGGPGPGPEPGVLTNGVPVTGLSGAANAELRYTLAVPAGASNLVIQTSGGTGDADLYVQFGNAPTTQSYLCRPYLNGNNESCSVAAPSTGTYHVMVRGYTTFSGLTLVGSYTAGGGGGSSFFENTADYAINNLQTVESPISVSRAGNAPSNLQVAVRIIHTYRGDLVVNLVAPDGSTYLLHNATGGSADNLIGTYSVNASSEAATGTWKLRVYDRANGDTGYIDSWSLQF